MKIKVDGSYRVLVKAALFLVPTISVVISFFTLPIEWAVSTSIFLVVTPALLNWFVFEYSVLHVMPLPTDEMLRYSLGSSWVADNLDTLDGLGLTLIYKYKETAQDAFQMLKAWNYGKVIDEYSNITLSAVSEGSEKYSVFLFPGDRLDSINNTKNIVEKDKGNNSKANVKVVKFYIQLCFNYKDSTLKKKCIESLPYVRELKLNVAYVKDDEIIMYSKTGFRLQNFSFQERESPNLGQLEKSLPWSEIGKSQPDIFKAIIEKVNNKIDVEKSI